MLRITKESEYAFLLLGALLRENNRAQSAASLAATSGVAITMSSKVLKHLVKSKVLTSVRGVYGGYQLSRKPEEISALEVVEAIEGSLKLVACVNSEKKSCALAMRCQISPFWQNLNNEICEMLQKRTLADMQLIDNMNRVNNEQ